MMCPLSPRIDVENVDPGSLSFRREHPAALAGLSYACRLLRSCHLLITWHLEHLFDDELFLLHRASRGHPHVHAVVDETI